MNNQSRSGMLWSQQEERDVLDMFHNGYSIKDIAARFQRREDAIEIRLEKFGIAKFQGSLARFEKENKIKTPAQKVGILCDKFIVWGPGGTNGNCAVPWPYVKRLKDDLLNAQAGATIPQYAHVWNNISTFSEYTTHKWVKLSDFTSLREEVREMFKKNSVKHAPQIPEGKQQQKHQKRATFSVERRRLLLI